MSSEIPQRNVDLVSGFMKDIVMSRDSPAEINNLCLSYANLNCDEFLEAYADSKKDVTFQDDRVVAGFAGLQSVYINQRNVYLNNIASRGIHTWKFKMIQRSSLKSTDLYKLFNYANVGIFKTKYEMRLAGKFYTASEDDKIVTGYGIDFAGYATGRIGKRRKHYGFKMEDQDIIEMKLNMTELTLSIIAKGTDYGKIFDIEDTEYRAVVGMSHVDDGWELVSHQHIY